MPKTRFLLLLAVLAGAADAGAQVVLQRARLGHNVDEIAYIATGPDADHVVTLDGYDVFAVPASGGGPFRKLFDLRGLQLSPFGGHASGVTFIDSEGLFAFIQGYFDPFTLVMSDRAGRPAGTRTIQYLDGFQPATAEGLDTLPAHAPFPGHLVLAVTSPAGDARIEVLTPAGVVVHEIKPDPPIGDSGGICALGFQSPSHLLVTLCGNQTWVLDFAGHVRFGPVKLAEADSIEGLVETADGRVAIADYYSGKVFLADRRLGLLAERDNRFGVGLTLPRGLAWDTERNRHLVASALPVNPPGCCGVHRVPRSLDAATALSTISACGFFPAVFRGTRLTYLPDESRFALGNRRLPLIPIFEDDGSLAEQVDVSAVGNPAVIAYVPPTREFALRVLGMPGLEQVLRIVSRSGGLVRDVDLAPTGLPGIGAVTYFNPAHPSGGQFLVAGDGPLFPFSGRPDHVIETDFDGNLIAVHDLRTALGVLGISDFSTITTGPQAGALALVDGISSELVVFRLH